MLICGYQPPAAPSPSLTRWLGIKPNKMTIFHITDGYDTVKYSHSVLTPVPPLCSNIPRWVFYRGQFMNIKQLLELMVKSGASDMHLKIPNPPVLRIDGALSRPDDLAPVTADELVQVFNEITTESQKERFAQEQELDFAISVPGLARFRVNVMRQRGTLGFNFRLVPFQVLTLDMLGLPSLLGKLILKPRGLILITGPTGSGKSTTMAAMIDHLNHKRGATVITIEDPIEYIHRDQRCVISQRELGEDTHSFAEALRHALRHDPDVIVVGEIRDLETVTTALAAAETGHLVLGTLHTVNATQTIDRIIDMYPPDQQHQIRLQMSQVLEAIVSQTLVMRATGRGRVAALEILLANTAVRNLLRGGQTFELNSILQLNRKSGMQTLDQDLFDLVKSKTITLEEALLKSSDPEKLEEKIKNTK